MTFVSKAKQTSSAGAPPVNGVLPRVQYAALPYRLKAGGALEILLVTSRGTGRWIIPKGWPMAGHSPHEAAGQEAFEEGGIRGRIRAKPLGSFRYEKQRDEDSLECEVTVFAMQVTEELTEWPERHQRQTKWFSVADAAEAVNEPGLAALIRQLAAKR